MAQDLTLRIAAQNEALAELEKTRAQVVTLMQQLQAGGAKISTVTRTTTEGLSSVRRGLESLAAQATGVEGPVGRIASGLLMFGTGGTVTLGVVAGIGAIAGAYRLAKDAADALAEANEKAAESFRHVLESGRPNVVAQNAFLTAQDELGKAQERLTELQESRDPTKAAFWKGFHLPATTAEIATQQGTVDILTEKVNRLREAWQGVHTTITTTRREKDEEAAYQQFLSDRIQEHLDQLREVTRFGGPALRLPGGVGSPGHLAALARAGAPSLRGRPEYAEYSPGYRIPQDDTGMPPRADWTAIAAAAVATLSSARGGLGGFVAGAGGLAARIPGGQAVGTALSLGSAFLSLFGGGGTVRVSIARLEEQAKQDMREVQQTPQNVSVVIAGQTSGRATKYALDYQTGLDTSSRIPY